jgi:hypothetical protein
MCSELKLEISDHMNEFYEILKIRQNICEINELFEQNFGTLFEFSDQDFNFVKEIDLNSCEIVFEESIKNGSKKLNHIYI